MLKQVIEFEGTYEGDLLGNVDSVDVLITIPRERAVSHHGVLGTSILIVY